MSHREISAQNVCVVGGAGFLGSHLVDHLVNDRYCSVLVIDNLCAGHKKFIHPMANFFHHDITGSEEFLRKLFQREKIRFVFNYAAWPYIEDSYIRPLHVFEVNCMGAIKVINAAQEAGCEGVLQVSSAELYGSNMNGQLSELSPVEPHSTYGAAKAAVDAYCRCAWKERKTPVIALRQFNCVGERETHPYVIPEIISQIAKQHELRGQDAHIIPGVSLGNNSTRDFLYAGDAVRMAVELLEKGEFGQVYNLGSEDCIKIYDLAKLIGEIMGFERVMIHTDPSRIRPWEVWSLTSDNTKLHAAIHYRPRVNLREALERTIGYFRNNENRWDW
jgi:nucleoside-diphosphate-sugar epimerase